jgi:hypothetical protein
MSRAVTNHTCLGDMDVDWDALLPRSGKTDKNEDIMTILSLMSFLNISFKDLAIYFFSRTGSKNKHQAGLSLSPRNGFLPKLLLDLWWKNHPTCHKSLKGVIDQFARIIVLEESDAAIESPDLRIVVSKCTIKQLQERLDPQHLLQTLKALMPFTSGWLLHAASAPNNYRKRTAKSKGALNDESDKGSDEELEYEDDGKDGKDGGWQAQYPGFRVIYPARCPD